MLEGRDREWQDVGNDRQVQYSNLPPGSYRFRVTGSNNSGVWNDTGATLEFSIAPAYYQTPWFAALLVIATAALLWEAYRLRVAHIARQFDRTLDARVSERTRIARDLHDTLLQSFHGVLLRLHTVSQVLENRPTVAQEMLDSTIKQVADAVTEGRDAVQGLRDSTIQAMISARPSALSDKNSRRTQPTTDLPSMSRLRARREGCIPSSGTRCTRLLRKRFATRSGTRAQSASRLRFAMTTSNSDYAFGTMEKA